MRTAVIVGAGIAGTELHAAALRTLAPQRPVVYVDPWVSHRPHLFRTLEACAEAVPVDDWVVHICSPTGTHVQLLTEAAALGARHIILEKPIASTHEDLDCLVEIADRTQNTHIVPVAIWPHARAVHAVREMIDKEVRRGRATEISILVEQHKNRAVDSHRGRGGSASVFDVEFPHMMLLSHHLLGSFRSVAVQEVRFGGAPAVPVSCSVEVQHLNGAVSRLSSALDRSPRRRRVTVSVADAGPELVVDLPRSRFEPYAIVRRREVISTYLTERPLDQFLAAAYQLFEAGGPELPVSFDDHVAATRRILDLKREGQQNYTRRISRGS